MASLSLRAIRARNAGLPFFFPFRTCFPRPPRPFTAEINKIILFFGDWSRLSPSPPEIVCSASSSWRISVLAIDTFPILLLPLHLLGTLLSMTFFLRSGRILFTFYLSSRLPPQPCPATAPGATMGCPSVGIQRMLPSTTGTQRSFCFLFLRSCLLSYAHALPKSRSSYPDMGSAFHIFRLCVK